MAVVQARIEDPDDDELEDEPLALRLAAGLFTVQQAALVVANLWQTGDPGMQKRLLQLLHQQVRSTLHPTKSCHQAWDDAPLTCEQPCNTLSSHELSGVVTAS